MVNKVDKPWELPGDFYDFYELGLGEPIAVSAVNKLNFGDVLDEIVESFPKDMEPEDEDTIKIAVIGKAKCGKILSCQLPAGRKQGDSFSYSRHDQRFHRYAF